MTDPTVPRNSEWVMRALGRALDGLPELPEHDFHEILRFMNEELPRFEQSDTSYLIIGSYRNEHRIRLRGFVHALGMASNADTIILGDTIDLDTDVVPAFDVKLFLLGEGADFIAGVYEKEDGGEGPELGVLRGVFAQKTHVLPQDFAGLDEDSYEDADDIRRAALDIYFSDGDDDQIREELLRLLTVADNNGIDIDERMLTDFLKEREENGNPPATYSWVHLNFFEYFDRLGQCYPWFTEKELFQRTKALPGPNAPQWEHEFDVEDLR